MLREAEVDLFASWSSHQDRTVQRSVQHLLLSLLLLLHAFPAKRQVASADVLQVNAAKMLPCVRLAR